MSGPCAFHDQSMEALRVTLVDIKEQMREGLAALKSQADVFGQTIAKFAESQSARQALCAQQNQRLNTVEQTQALHRENHTKDRDEYVKERADTWSAINTLRRHVYIGLGGFLVIQTVLIPIALHYLKGN